MSKQNTKKISDKEIRDLVVARLRALSGGRKISIGGDREFTKDELVERVRKGDKIGEKIVDIQLNYLKSLKEGIFSNE